MKALRTFLAESLDEQWSVDVAPGLRPELVEGAVEATRDWLAQAEILVIISNGMAESGTVGGAALALRREAVK